MASGAEHVGAALGMTRRIALDRLPLSTAKDADRARPESEILLLQAFGSQ
jgi:hypothetical protein